MKILRICLAQINMAVGGLEGNADKIITYIERARSLNSDIVVFPELALSGYPPEDLLLKPDFIRENRKYLGKIIKASKSILSIVGFPYMSGRKIYNSAAMIYDGRLAGVYNKVFLPNYSVFDEKRYFAAGEHCPVAVFGRDVSVGVNICEDIWYPEGPQRTQALLGGAGVIINISSSPYYAQKIKAREDMLAKRAKENSAFVFYCNSVGGQDALVFDGGSSVFDYNGRLLARGRQFEEDLVAVDVDIEKLKHRKKPAVSHGISFCLPKSSIKPIRLGGVTDKENVFPGKIEKRLPYLDEIYAALAAGIRDYIRKNNFRKVVLGLSGGIDSALVAVLAVDALGKENVVALTMPSMYSTSGTKRDAEKVARNLGIKLISVPINGVYKKYLDLLKPYFKGHKPGVAEENIQARIRGNILMAFSNKFGWLVFNTGNKSEIGTGYCTLYGDMTGGFAVLKDVSKTLVYALSRHRNGKKAKPVIPESIFLRAPSAELRKNQKDQDVLPPYPLLDKILDLYVEKNKSLGEIVGRKIDKRIAKKVILMVDKNEYKRRQTPVGIKITPRAFGKDRRMPITNLFTK